jgi:predicted DCC family thiol-disulfide oxidoreductase YuxK
MLARNAFSYRDDPAVPDFADDRPIIFFDGVCVLCSGFVGHVLRNDWHDRFRFCTTQSETGQAVYRHYGLDPVNNWTFLLLEDGMAWQKSDAALRAARNMWQPWPLMRVFGLLPRFVRDGFYDLVAKYRYRVFGRMEACMVPLSDDAGRFL